MEICFQKEHWTRSDYEELLRYLSQIGEKDYQKFNQSLVPGEVKMYGVRIPALREMAKQIAKGNVEEYLALPKGDFNEEVMLEGFVIARLKLDDWKFRELMNSFVDKINNWQSCDTVATSCKQIKKFKSEYKEDIKGFLKSSNPWHQRFAIILLMSFYLEKEDVSDTLELVYQIDSEFYYVQMAAAWLLATALAKQRNITLEYFEKGIKNDTIVNMAVKKARESFRITKEDKEMLLQYKRS